MRLEASGSPGPVEVGAVQLPQKSRSPPKAGPQGSCNTPSPAAPKHRQSRVTDSPHSAPRETKSSLLRKSVSHSKDKSPGDRSLAAAMSQIDLSSPKETRASLLRRSMHIMAPSRSPLHAASPAGEGIAFELHRLRDEARLHAEQAAAAAGEASTLSQLLTTKDRALTAAATEAAALHSRALTAEAAAATKARELKLAEAECARLRSEAAAAGRQADKATAKLHALPSDDGMSELVATLEAELKQAEAFKGMLAKDNRGVYNVLRAKDKELDVAKLKAAEAISSSMRCQELENVVLELQAQLAEAAREAATQAAVARVKDGELARAAAGVEAAQQLREAGQQLLAQTAADLRASQEEGQRLQQEVATLQEELTRVGTVASRATSREVAGSFKEAGVIPVPAYLEEVRYLQGEIERQQQKLALVQRNAASTQAQKEKLQRQLDAQAARKARHTPEAARKLQVKLRTPSDTGSPLPDSRRSAAADKSGSPFAKGKDGNPAYGTLAEE